MVNLGSRMWRKLEHTQPIKPKKKIRPKRQIKFRKEIAFTLGINLGINVIRTERIFGYEYALIIPFLCFVFTFFVEIERRG